MKQTEQGENKRMEKPWAPLKFSVCSSNHTSTSFSFVPFPPSGFISFIAAANSPDEGATQSCALVGSRMPVCNINPWICHQSKVSSSHHPALTALCAFHLYSQHEETQVKITTTIDYQLTGVYLLAVE